MIAKKTYWAIVWMLFLSYSGMAQQLDCVEQLPFEKVVLHLDKTYCIAGDSIWFKAYCLQENQQKSPLSKVLYVEIYNESKKAISQQKIKLVDGITWGAIGIPESAKTGYYFLRAYTQYMRNFSMLDYYHQELTIVNPSLAAVPLVEQPITSSLEAEDQPTTALKVNAFYQSMEIVTPEIKNLQKSYGQRALVQLNLKLPEMDMAAISLVVRKKGLANQSSDSLSKLAVKNPWLLPAYLNNNRQGLTEAGRVPQKLLTELNQLYEKEPTIFAVKPPTELKYIPEINNVSLSGIIRNKSTKTPVSGALAMAAIIDEKTQLHLAYTKENGAFIFDLNHQQGGQNLFVSTDRRGNEDLEVLINNDFSTDFPEIYPVPLQIDAAEHLIIENLYLESELKKNYQSTPQKSVFTNKEWLTAKANILNPDLRITLSDYIDIPNLREIFAEIVPGVSLKKKNGKTYLNVFNIREQIDLKEGLVLLDNVPIFDIEQLLEISPKKIESIDVFNTPYMLGEYKINGLIRIKTNTLDFAGYVWENEAAFVNFKTISASPVFQQSIYTHKNRTPDFRNVLYWHPNLVMDTTQKVVEFYTSDMTGTYEVQINGFTKEGFPCYQQAFFEVKK